MIPDYHVDCIHYRLQHVWQHFLEVLILVLDDLGQVQVGFQQHEFFFLLLDIVHALIQVVEKVGFVFILQQSADYVQPEVVILVDVGQVLKSAFVLAQSSVHISIRYVQRKVQKLLRKLVEDLIWYLRYYLRNLVHQFNALLLLNFLRDELAGSRQKVAAKGLEIVLLLGRLL